MFVYTTAVRKIRKMKARKKVVQGGTSAGKTQAIIPILIDKAARIPKLKITIVAETIPAVKDGAVDIFKTVMQDTGRWIESHWIGNPLQYTFTNGSRIQFKAFDTVGKAKASGKRDILFINEANHISFAIADALMIRSKEVYIDFNPDNEFWVHTEVLQAPGSEFLRLTYRDNEAIPPEILEEMLIKKNKAFFNPDLESDELFADKNIKNKYWANWWKVYGEGLTGVLEGIIFQNWKTIKSIPEDAKLIGRGLDFGFTNHPSAAVELWQWNGKYIWNEIIYERGLTNPQIAKRLKSEGAVKNDYIYADSAEPKSIAEINQYGLSVKGAVKGADSINFGIDVLQQNEFYVTERSTNLMTELRKYCWDTDKDGNYLNRPIDAFNHVIDAMRYVAVEKMTLSRKRNTTWGRSRLA